MEQAFVTEPYDYTKKTLKVEGFNREMHKLKARVEPLERDMVWTVYTPRR